MVYKKIKKTLRINNGHGYRDVLGGTRPCVLSIRFYGQV